MATEPRPLHALVVSVDISLLHEIAWMLEAVGYQVQTTNDFSADALWRRYASPDFLLVDGRNLAEPGVDVFAHDSQQPHYRMFVYEGAQSTSLAGWYAAGAHDALRTPVSRGELLTRFRTGARYLEFERRLRERSSFADVAGLYSRRGLLRKLGQAAANNDLESTAHTLLATSIDWYAGICRKCGETVGGELLSKAARAIRRAAGENAICAYLGDGRFATLLAGHSTTEVKSIAETIANEFGSREGLGESIPSPTLTTAVVRWNAGVKATRLLIDALETLALAGHSGGDCLVLEGEFSAELTGWQEEMSTGNPFANVVAQDIMEPFPALLEQDAPHGELAEALRMANVPVRPYVDREGRLVGLASDDGDAEETRSGLASNSGSESFAKPETISHDASFPEIYEAFCTRGCGALVVTAGDQPLGYITCDGFLSMVDPIHADSFTRTNKSADEVAYLMVPTAMGEVSGEAAESQSPLSAVK
jgi:GGDEF domain-containing protein